MTAIGRADEVPATRVRGQGPARRAIVRWAWRMFRREWRQQALVLALLTVAVAGALGTAAAAYDLAPRGAESEFGTADHTITWESPSPADVTAIAAAAQQHFGTADIVTRQTVRFPGSTRDVDYRDQDPHAAYGGPTLALRSGRWPTAASEVAVTDGVAALSGLAVGGVLDLDGTTRTVVGVVEDPSDLDDEFALVAPGTVVAPTSVTAFVAASIDLVQSFGPTTQPRLISGRGDGDDGLLAAIGVLVVACLALLLVALVASASFLVVAQRRLRQLGMLGSIGATERHLRLVTIANGVVLGVVGAVVGAALGIVGWIAVQPRVEEAAGARFPTFDMPWWLVAAVVLLAIGAATGAAAWPARTVARIPLVQALSGRQSRPEPVHRSARVAAVLVVVGTGCLLLGSRVVDTDPITWRNRLLMAGGTLVTVLGVLLLSPLAVRALARAGARLPITLRLPLRDLGRHQARSAAALAAVSLVLGIPVAIVVVAAGAQHAAGAGNLGTDQLVVRIADLRKVGPEAPATADLSALQAGVDRLVAELPGAQAITLQVASDPAVPAPPGSGGRMSISLGGADDQGWRFLSPLYVATPELLARYGVTPDPGVEFLTTQSGDIGILGTAGARASNRAGDRSSVPRLTDAGHLTPGHTSVPGSFVTPEALTARGWVAVPAGEWFVETPTTLTDDQLRLARQIAAGAGLEVESRDRQGGLVTLRRSATAVGVVLALGLLAMTVGLVRGESAADLRTLTATGATRRARRNLTAATAGGLALAGAVLGTAGAALVLVAAFDSLDDLRPVPVGQLVLIALGTPVLAALGGWSAVGRDPSDIARQPIG